jgi:hypothetical protein
MKAVWLARRLGMDGNPLRRRSDRIAVCLGALLVALFLIGAPVLGVAAFGWASHAGAGPLGHAAAVRGFTAAAFATATLGIVVCCLARAGRAVLDRHRLAAWEAAWSAVGPLWTRRFRPRR